MRVMASLLNLFPMILRNCRDVISMLLYSMYLARLIAPYHHHSAGMCPQYDSKPRPAGFTSRHRGSLVRSARLIPVTGSSKLPRKLSAG